VKEHATYVTTDLYDQWSGRVTYGHFETAHNGTGNRKLSELTTSDGWTVVATGIRTPHDIRDKVEYHFILERDFRPAEAVKESP
jgi:hypothetical protein